MRRIRFSLRTLIAATTVASFVPAAALWLHQNQLRDTEIVNRIGETNDAPMLIVDQIEPPQHSGGVALPPEFGGIAWRSSVTPSFLKHLPGSIQRFCFTRVESIHLRPNHIDPSCVGAVAKLDALKYVALNGMDVSEEAIVKLKAALPDATIQNVSYSLWGALGQRMEPKEDSEPNDATERRSQAF